MERGVVVGGTLIALSALAALALHSQSARQALPEANVQSPTRSATDVVPELSAETQHEAAGIYEDKDALLEYLKTF